MDTMKMIYRTMVTGFEVIVVGVCRTMFAVVAITAAAALVIAKSCESFAAVFDSPYTYVTGRTVVRLWGPRADAD